MPRRGPKAGNEGSAPSGRHIPVLLASVLEALQPRDGETYIDATFGAGGYTRAILEAADCRVIAFDRDPTAIAAASPMLAEFGDRLLLIQAPFGDLLDMACDTAELPTDVGKTPNTGLPSVGQQEPPNTGLPSVGEENETSTTATPTAKGSPPNMGSPNVGAQTIDGVVFDLGVSSMQLDQAERGFSFQSDGPLDMRMGSVGSLSLDESTSRTDVGDAVQGIPPNTDKNSLLEGNSPNTATNSTVEGNSPNTGLPSVGAQKSAADVLNTYSETDIADILFHLGEERRSRAIARAIVARRAEKPFTRTLELANLIAKVIGRGPTGKNPATRTFQALRMYVNDELGQLVKGLAGAERALRPGGRLVVVTFHSLEDRIVKRFLASRAGRTEGVSRHLPAPVDSILPPSFQIINLRSLTSSKAELESNPRARSARLRSAVRTDANPWPVEAGDLGLPQLDMEN